MDISAFERRNSYSYMCFGDVWITVLAFRTTLPEVISHVREHLDVYEKPFILQSINWLSADQAQYFVDEDIADIVVGDYPV